MKVGWESAQAIGAPIELRWQVDVREIGVAERMRQLFGMNSHPHGVGAGFNDGYQPSVGNPLA